MCILTVVLSSLSIFNKLKISDFIFPLFGRFISGMGPNPVLMELEKKKVVHITMIYTILHQPKTLPYIILLEIHSAHCFNSC